jgi:hypothetical protein
VPASLHLGLDLVQLGLHTRSHGAPLDLIPSSLEVSPTDVGKSQEVEGVGAPSLTPPLSVPEGEPPELDEARLAGMQLQAELCESFA